MKKTAKTTFTLFLTALILTGLAACNKGPAPSTTTDTAATVKADVTTVYTLDVSGDGSDDASDAASDPSESSQDKSGSRAPAGAFRSAELIKIGEHT